MRPKRIPSFRHQRRAFDEGRYLRVLNYHNTPASKADELECELATHLESYESLTFDDLDVFCETGRWPSSRPRFVAAFYDGYRNNATVAAPLCQRLGLTAWFLPPTGWIATDPAEQQAYAKAHGIKLVDEELAQNRLAMTWDDVAAIGSYHVVCAHTATHAADQEVITDSDAKRELVDPRRAIERRTGCAPIAMAWRRGAPYDAEAPVARALLDAGYRFVISNTAIQRIASR